MDEHNTTKLHALSQTTGVPIAMIRGINSCPGAAKASKKMAGGLENLLNVGVGAIVMLTQNLWIKYGLVNGASGKVVDLVGENGICDVIIVDIPRYSGPALCGAHPRTWIPIPRSSAQWFSGGSTRERKQFPLTLAYAITIHKSQGSTFLPGTDLVIDIGVLFVRLFECLFACNFTQLQGLGTWLRGSRMLPSQGTLSASIFFIPVIPIRGLTSISMLLHSSCACARNCGCVPWIVRKYVCVLLCIRVIVCLFLRGCPPSQLRCLHMCTNNI